MPPRPIDFIGAALLAAVLIGLVVVLVTGNNPVADARSGRGPRPGDGVPKCVYATHRWRQESMLHPDRPGSELMHGGSARSCYRHNHEISGSCSS
jgi:hypothetical protein